MGVLSFLCLSEPSSYLNLPSFLGLTEPRRSSVSNKDPAGSCSLGFQMLYVLPKPTAIPECFKQSSSQAILKPPGPHSVLFVKRVGNKIHRFGSCWSHIRTVYECGSMPGWAEPNILIAMVEVEP